MKNRSIYRVNYLLQSESLPGILLLTSVAISMLLANSPIATGFERLLAQQLGFTNAYLTLEFPLLLWINDGLMAIFFLLVGLEIKREAVVGELASIKRAALPIIAALGGVIVPALLYALLNKNTLTANGWGIPMATDIAFALAVVKALGNKVPASLKVFLSVLAVVDDLSAIVVIAVFYSTGLQGIYLGYAAGIMMLLFAFNRLGVRHLAFYLVPGVVMWYLIHHSGIHATIAGVVTAFMIPVQSTTTPSPLVKLEHALARPVSFLIMPLFALANTNIRFESGMLEGMTSPLGLGIVLGLIVGKPVGIFLFSYVSVKTGLSALPSGAHWPHIVGVGILGGIGFTISIFVANLSFASPLLLSQAKFAVLIGSVLAAGLGYSALRTLARS